MVAEDNDVYDLYNETEETLRIKMENAAKNFDFILAAKYRDEIIKIKGK